jgi:hypothetical protein
MLGGAADLARVLGLLPAVELGRRSRGYAALVEQLRARGRGAAPRSAEDRERLRRVIRLVDRLMPDRGNCYRRVLLEIALDKDAAEEPIRIGLREHGGPRSGHVWLADRDAAGAYDAEFVT